MKKTLFALALASALAAGALRASPGPSVALHSGRALELPGARVEAAPGGGSYVTGLVEPVLGYAVPRAAHLHITAYDAKGRVLGEKTDPLARSLLVRSHFQPQPRETYAVFLPCAPSQIARVDIVEHSGHRHSVP